MKVCLESNLFFPRFVVSLQMQLSTIDSIMNLGFFFYLCHSSHVKDVQVQSIIAEDRDALGFKAAVTIFYRSDFEQIIIIMG